MEQLIHEVILRHKFNVLGYKTGDIILPFDNDFKNIENFLHTELNELRSNYKLRCINTKNNLIKDARNFLDNLFRLHDVKCVSQELIKNKEDNELAFLLEKTSSLKSPYEIPIQFSFESNVREKVYNNIIYFYMICLERRFSKELLPIYVHELAHTQLDSQKGIVENYHNSEVLSIFLEKLSSWMFDKTGMLYEKICIERYYDILRCINVINKSEYDYLYRVEASVFLNSILKADYLFSVYLKMNNIQKKEMLSWIQNVFDGKVTVEDFLDRYNVSLDVSKEMFVKKRIKH